MKKKFKKFLDRYLNPKDSRENEKLVIRYYEDLQENDPETYIQKTDGQFDEERVFSQILNKIERNRKVVSRPGRRIFKIAASVIILSALSVILYQYKAPFLDYIDPVIVKEQVTVNGKTGYIELSDQTRVWLNAGSKLQYPSKFKENIREVTLVGEGYFEVTHDSSCPFIIRTNDVQTNVLGTSFNISAYEEDKNVEVTVLTGKVGVIVHTPEGKSLSTVYIDPNQRATYNKSEKTIEKSTADATSAIGWKERKLSFKRVLLPEIITEIQRTYGVTIQADKNLQTCSLSVDFNQESLDNVLIILAELINGKIVSHNGYYELIGRGCDETANILIKQDYSLNNKIMT